MKTRTTSEYLDAVKEKLKISSDYGLQKPLGVTKSAVSWLVNGGTMNNTTAARVAGILDISLAKVIADMEFERARIHDARMDGFASEKQVFWERIARKVATAAAVAIGAGTLGLAPSPSQAAQLGASGAPVYYVK